jgi:hypothetical protein
MAVLICASVASAPVAAGTGAIEGQALYEGEAPRPTIVMEGGRTQEVLYVDKSGGLRYAVAFLSDAPNVEPADEVASDLRLATGVPVN